MIRLRGTLTSFGRTARTVLGALFVLFGVLVLTGLDRQIETWLVVASQMWLTTLTTSF